MIRIARVVGIVLALTIGCAVALPDFSPAYADTQTQTKKKKKKKTTQARSGVKKNYQATPPGQPNQAGMTDDCSFWYNTQGRMPVGCNKYGRSFYMYDDW
jgi:hypothetical protein